MCLRGVMKLCLCQKKTWNHSCPRNGKKKHFFLIQLIFIKFFCERAQIKYNIGTQNGHQSQRNSENTLCLWSQHFIFSKCTQLFTSAAYTCKPCTIKSTKCKKLTNKGSFKKNIYHELSQESQSFKYIKNKGTISNIFSTNMKKIQKFG